MRDRGDEGGGRDNGDLEGPSILGLHMTMCCWQMPVMVPYKTITTTA